MLIETERLRLRPVLPSDAEETARLMTPGVARNLISWRAPMLAQEARCRIHESRKGARAGTSLDLAILLKEPEALLGWIGFFTAAGQPEFRLGFWIGEAYQGRGFMREALLAAVPAVMTRLDIDSIAAETFDDNSASMRLLEHLGMRRCGRGLMASGARPGPAPTVKLRLDKIPIS